MENTNSWVGKVFRFFVFDKRSSVIWFFIRIYVGWQWLSAGWEKLGTSVWTGSSAGTALQGFLNGSLAKTIGAHPDVSSWYGWFLGHIVIPHAVLFSYLVTFGEMFVGIALILGLFTALAASFGAFMNFNYLFAGTVSSNPWLLLLALFLITGRRVSGFIGLDPLVKNFRVNRKNKLAVTY